MKPFKYDKPKVELIQSLDFFDLKDWCEQEYSLDLNNFLSDLEAGNDSYAVAWISCMESSQYDYQKELAKILKKDFGITTDKIALWVCW